MVIVAGRFEVEPAERDRFLAAHESLMRASRAEPGCVTYVFSGDPLDPAVVHLFELWETGEALAAHLTRLRADPPPPAGVQVRSATVEQYEIASVGPVGG